MEDQMSTEEQEQRSESRIIGMDAHPSMFSAATLEGRDAATARVVEVNDRLPIEQLDRWLERHVRSGDVIALEASGNTFAIVERIRARGHKAVVLESASVGKIGRAYCATDKLDAIKIARVWLSGLAHVVWTPDEKSAARREVFFSYRNSVKDTTRARNHIWAFLNQHGLRRPRHLRMTLGCAKDHVLGMRAWTPLQQELIADLFESLWNAEARRKKFKTLIAQEVATDDAMLQLVRLTGIRDIIAFALTAFIGDIARFRTPKNLVSYIGLNPRVSISGAGGGTGPLAHAGRSDHRSLLIQAAQSVLRYGNATAQHRWAVALKMRKGANVAVAALARKITVAVWYLMNGCFTPMTELSAQLSIKLHKIAYSIGAARLKKAGFASVREFQHELSQKLLSAS
jgi:transposase